MGLQDMQMEGNNPAWNLLKSWATIVGTIASAGSVVITYLFVPPQYRWALPPIGAAVLVIGVVVAASKVIKQNQIQTGEEVRNRDQEIARLRSEIETLRIKPYDIALEREGRRKLQEFTDEERKGLVYILMHAPVHSQRFIQSGIAENARSG